IMIIFLRATLMKLVLNNPAFLIHIFSIQRAEIKKIKIKDKLKILYNSNDLKSFDFSKNSDKARVYVPSL
ncbi:MAG: hypothetical protein AB8W08_03300, partial [Coxiella endosymbiont of Dermacentor silvarum]